VLFGGVGFVVVVADQPRVIARWQSDAFTSASSGTHTVVVIGITVRSATPGGLDRCEQGSTKKRKGARDSHVLVYTERRV